MWVFFSLCFDIVMLEGNPKILTVLKVILTLRLRKTKVKKYLMYIRKEYSMMNMSAAYSGVSTIDIMINIFNFP